MSNDRPCDTHEPMYDRTGDLLREKYFLAGENERMKMILRRVCVVSAEYPQDPIPSGLLREIMNFALENENE